MSFLLNNFNIFCNLFISIWHLKLFQKCFAHTLQETNQLKKDFRFACNSPIPSHLRLRVYGKTSMFISYFVKFSFLFSSLMYYLFNSIHFKHIKQSSFCLVLDFLITSTSASLTTQKPLTVCIPKNYGKYWDGNIRPPYLLPEKPVCRSISNT